LESGYVSTLTATTTYTEAWGGKKMVLYDYGNIYVNFNESGDYLVFKSRLRRDEEGNVISANYGKIYGEFEFLGSEQVKKASVTFLYYFNPTSNDRNIEFGQGKNLFSPKEHNTSGNLLIP
jgi:hypothetical protein